MAMRSVGSSVANGRIGRYMKRVWVEEVAQKPGQTFLVLAGSILVANYKQTEELRKLITQYREEKAEIEMWQKVISERTRDYLAQVNNFMMLRLAARRK